MTAQLDPQTTPIDFARRCKLRGPCAQFVAHWLNLQGVAGAPSRREILRDWRRFGVTEGVALWCEKIGLIACAPGPGAIALAEQGALGERLLGLIDANGLFVTRSFGRVLIQRDPIIVRAWRV